MVVDPPRKGCERILLEKIASVNPEKIVYVSCAPDTQARDLKILSQKYDAVEIQPFDMFCHTYHIENVAIIKVL